MASCPMAQVDGSRRRNYVFPDGWSNFPLFVDETAGFVTQVHRSTGRTHVAPERVVFGSVFFQWSPTETLSGGRVPVFAYRSLPNEALGHVGGERALLKVGDNLGQDMEVLETLRVHFPQCALALVKSVELHLLSSFNDDDDNDDGNNFNMEVDEEDEAGGEDGGGENNTAQQDNKVSFLWMEAWDGDFIDLTPNLLKWYRLNPAQHVLIVTNLVAQLLGMVSCLAALDLLYTDAKPANTLYRCQNGRLQVTFADLGAAVRRTSSRFKGIATYPPPERMVGMTPGQFKGAATESDVAWGLGIIWLGLLDYDLAAYQWNSADYARRATNTSPNTLSSPYVKTLAVRDHQALLENAISIAYETGAMTRQQLAVWEKLLRGLLAWNHEQRLSLREARKLVGELLL